MSWYVTFSMTAVTDFSFVVTACMSSCICFDFLANTTITYVNIYYTVSQKNKPL